MKSAESTTSEAAIDGRAKAGGSPAAEGGLDLSLGHLGTRQHKHAASRPSELGFHPVPEAADPFDYLAVCDACHFTMSEEVYKAAERLAGPMDDPKCPGCGRRAWTFF